MNKSHPCRFRGILGVLLLLAFFHPSMLPGGVYVREVVLKNDPGEAGAPQVIQISNGPLTLQCMDMKTWKWSSGGWGFDAAALSPDSRTAVVGVKFEQLKDEKGKVIEKMGPDAYALLKARWDADAVAGSKTIEQWVGDEHSPDLVVRFTQIDGKQTYVGVYRYTFIDGYCLTIGMISHPDMKNASLSMYARFNGSLAKADTR